MSSSSSSKKTKSGFERKKLSNGKINPKYVDLLREDPPIAGQKFCCMSFTSPEKILKRKDQFIFDEFVKQWDLTKSMSKMNDFIHFISYKYNLIQEDFITDFQEFAKAESAKLQQESTFEDDYKNFVDKYGDKLGEQFDKENNFQTSVRGVINRGNFATEEQARMKCKSLLEGDPTHDIFVGPVGVWVPLDPDAYKTGDVEFMEEELNQLHKEKIKNELKAKEEFDARVKETKKKAIEDNIKLAEKSGNKLTQKLDENGELVGVKDTVDFEERDAAAGPPAANAPTEAPTTTVEDTVAGTKTET